MRSDRRSQENPCHPLVHLKQQCRKEIVTCRMTWCTKQPTANAKGPRCALLCAACGGVVQGLLPGDGSARCMSNAGARVQVCGFQ